MGQGGDHDKRTWTLTSCLEPKKNGVAGTAVDKLILDTARNDEPA